MSIRTQQSLSGFIASDPQLSFTKKGDARFYARIGQNHYRMEEDGTYTKVDTTFSNLVAFRGVAERAFERFAKGDNFLAEGYLHERESEAEGQTRQVQEFVAKKLGHDVAMSRYEVDRTPVAQASQQESGIEVTDRDAASGPVNARRSSAPPEASVGRGASARESRAVSL